MKVRALDSTTGKVKPGVFKIPVMVGKRHTTFCQLTCLGNVDGKLF